MPIIGITQFGAENDYGLYEPVISLEKWLKTTLIGFKTLILIGIGELMTNAVKIG
jgi:hypothetical protein